MTASAYAVSTFSGNTAGSQLDTKYSFENKSIDVGIICIANNSEDLRSKGIIVSKDFNKSFTYENIMKRIFYQ